MRLIGSASVSLNVKTSEDWERITGYRLIERYGSTEMSIGLSNPYKETEYQKRRAGSLGRPYGNTKVRIVEPNEEDRDSKHVLVESDSTTDRISKIGHDNRYLGEFQVKSDMVFKEYLNKPEQTKETFSDDAWLKTGIFHTILRNFM
jgi:long-subunit acyl-CoA synthetase (AMP-forming)